MEQRKKIILRLCAAWISILLFLTFFSNTIYALNLPGVTVGFPAKGIISSTNRAEGSLDFAENQNLYANYSGHIRFNLRVGDQVAPGDVLFSIYTDINDLRDQLEAEENRLERILLNRSAAQVQLQGLSPGVPSLPAPLPPDVSRFDHENTRLTAEIQRIEEEYETQRNLLDAGIISRDELAEISHRLANLRRDLARNQDEREQVMAEHLRSQARSAEEDRIQQQQQRRLYEAERNRLLHEINLFNMDENESRRTIARLSSQIEDGGVATVYAGDNSVVREIPDLQDGMYVGRNQLIMRLGILEGNRYATTVYFPERMGFLPVGTYVRVDIRSLREFGLLGEVRRMTPVQGRLRTEILFETDQPVTGGEGITVTVEQFSELFAQVLPNSAIRQDAMGYFVLFAAQEGHTFIGRSYVAREMRIHVWERGDGTTAFRMHLDIEYPIIIQSDRPVAAGDRIRLVADQ